MLTIRSDWSLPLSEHHFGQILLLLGLSVVIITAFQRLRVPTSLGYLLVGLLLGPYTIGPVVDSRYIQGFAEFGIVFLLFTIGLNFALPQLHRLRHQVLLLGTGQVVLTTAVVGFIAWLVGLPVAAAFVVGAVFAQSSTTIITKQLTDQGEENSRHGRLGTALSVFQDITAVPFVVVIPVLGMSLGAEALTWSLFWALGKAVLAFLIVFFVGRWLARPLFRAVTARRSAELFTLTVLFVSLTAAWITHSLGLSLAFGAFLAGMILGETEFRHQVESTVRPFRDVLLGLFFVGIGMLFGPSAILQIWHWALASAMVLLLSKTLLVALLVRWSGVDTLTAWRTGLLLAVGGEFGLALLALALAAQVIDVEAGQITLTAVLFSMILAPFFIRYNQAIASVLVNRKNRAQEPNAPSVSVEATGSFRDHVIICGYGRIGQSVGRFLEEENIPFVALDLDSLKVNDAHTAGEPAFYGDACERDILEAVGVSAARLVVISHEDVAATVKALHHIRSLRPDLPVMVRTRDETHVEELLGAGASVVVPETLEASLMIASHALLQLKVPLSRVVRRMQEQRNQRYQMLRELYRGDALTAGPDEQDADRLRPIALPSDSPSAGRKLADINFERVVVTALVRDGERLLSPPAETRLAPGDVLVLFGAPDDLNRAEQCLFS